MVIAFSMQAVLPSKDTTATRLLALGVLALCALGVNRLVAWGESAGF